MLSHIITIAMKLKVMRSSEFGDESLVVILLCPSQVVIEMNDRKNNPQLTSYLQQQAQERDRINPPGNSNTDAVPSLQQFLLPNMRKHALCEWMHGNMVHRRAKGIRKLAFADRRGRLSSHSLSSFVLCRSVFVVSVTEQGSSLRSAFGSSPQIPPPPCLPSSLCHACGRSLSRLQLLYHQQREGTAPSASHARGFSHSSSRCAHRLRPARRRP